MSRPMAFQGVRFRLHVGLFETRCSDSEARVVCYTILTLILIARVYDFIALILARAIRAFSRHRYKASLRIVWQSCQPMHRDGLDRIGRPISDKARLVTSAAVCRLGNERFTAYRTQVTDTTGWGPFQ